MNSTDPKTLISLNPQALGAAARILRCRAPEMTHDEAEALLSGLAKMVGDCPPERESNKLLPLPEDLPKPSPTLPLDDQL